MKLWRNPMKRLNHNLVLRIFIAACTLSVPCTQAMNPAPAAAPAASDDGPDLGPLFSFVGTALSNAGKGAAEVITAVGTQLNKGATIGKDFINDQIKAANERHERHKLELQTKLNDCDDKIAQLGARVAQPGL